MSCGPPAGEGRCSRVRMLWPNHALTETVHMLNRASSRAFRRRLWSPGRTAQGTAFHLVAASLTKAAAGTPTSQHPALPPAIPERSNGNADVVQATVTNLLAGVGYERSHGFVNTMGRRRSFDQFLAEGLDDLRRGVGDDRRVRSSLDAVAAPARGYKHLSLERRQKVVEELIAALESICDQLGRGDDALGLRSIKGKTLDEMPRQMAASPMEAESSSEAIKTVVLEPTQGITPDGLLRSQTSQIASLDEANIWEPGVQVDEDDITSFVPFVIDIETSGVRQGKDAVCELAALCLSTGKEFETLIRLPSGMTLSEEVQNITNITNAMLSQPGVPEFREVYAAFTSYVKEHTHAGGPGCVPLFVGHNLLAFDLPMVECQALGLGLTPLRGVKVLDTLMLARSLDIRASTGRQRLDHLYMHYTGKDLEGAHRAMADVRATAAVLEGLLTSAGVWTGSLKDFGSMALRLPTGSVVWAGTLSRRGASVKSQRPSTGTSLKQRMHEFGAGSSKAWTPILTDSDSTNPGSKSGSVVLEDAPQAFPLHDEETDAAALGQEEIEPGLSPLASSYTELWQHAIANADRCTCFLDTPLTDMRRPRRFTAPQLARLREAGILTLRQLLHSFPRDYTVMRYGVLPQLEGVHGSQPICLDAVLDSAVLRPMGRSGRMLEAVYRVLAEGSQGDADEDHVGSSNTADNAVTTGTESRAQTRIVLRKFRPWQDRVLGLELRSLLESVGRQVVVSGTVLPDRYGGAGDWVLAEQGHSVVAAEAAYLARLRDVGTLVQVHYGTRGQLSSSRLAAAVAKGLSCLKAAKGAWDDSLPGWVQEQAGLVSYVDALDGIHAPHSEAEFSSARLRLAFQEVFELQLHLLFQRKLLQQKAAGGGTTAPRADDAAGFIPLALRTLPYTLTAGQRTALEDILEQMRGEKGYPMAALLQGDVGCGKTVVAFLAALSVLGSGLQVAIMAPTEVLAAQHARAFGELLDDMRVKKLAEEDEEEETRCPASSLPSLALVTGSQRGAARRAAAEGLASGAIDIAVGTHALLSGSTQFRNLGLVIIDEQHRFGVAQRAALEEKATRDNNNDIIPIAPHVLALSATPIPRTLALLAYGDLEHVVIRERPPGREEVVTRVVDDSDGDARAAMYAHAREELDGGAHVYVVCPLVDPSRSPRLDEVPAATVERGRVAQGLGIDETTIGLLHGRMSAEDKALALDAFRKGQKPVLVSTSVVEVGVDVPEASIMIVERAELFGLAQLHQLRGRVGRGQRSATCYLVAGENATEKLGILTHARDGFEVAEHDLGLRGGGDVLGKRQSGRKLERADGFAALRVFALPRDTALVEPARKIAAAFLDDCPLPQDWPRELLIPLLKRMHSAREDE